MMMQSRWREHGSSGELDVFGATSYFAGLPPAPDDDCRRPSSATEPPADQLYFQAAKVVQRDTMTMGDNSFGGPHHRQQQPGLHGHSERHATNTQLMQVVAAKRLPSGKSRLAALLSFMVSPSPSPSPRASFRKEIINKDAPSMTTTRPRQAEAAAAGGKSRETDNCTFKAANSNSPSSSLPRESSSMLLQGLFGAHNDDDELVDLGVATGDRRLQGITVVRGGGGGGEERWVVRCVPGPGGAWDDEEEHREKMVDVDAAESKMLDAAESTSSERNIKDEMVEVEQGHGDDDGNIDPAHSWDSDSSSDLFDLDLEY